MANLFIAGVMEADLFNGDQLFSTAKTLLDSSIDISVDSTEVRAGTGGKLFGKFFHTSKFDMKFTDAMFKLEYIAKNIGSAVTMGGDGLVSESVTLGAGGTGAVTDTPIAFGSYGIVGWASKPNSGTTTTVVFTGKNFTYAGGADGDVVCVKYMKYDSSARALVVSSDIVPDTIKVVGRIGLYAGDNLSVASKVGYCQVVIERFQLNGTASISLTQNGVANVPLSGSALSVDSNTCEGGGYYALITEHISGKNWYDTAYAVAAVDDSLELSAINNTATLDIRALYTDAMPSKPPYANLSFVSSTPAVATVNASGVVSFVGAGNAVITVSITDKSTVSTQVNVTCV